MPNNDDNRTSQWERKEELVLQLLQDLRLSSDAALKGVGEVREKLIKVDAEQASYKEKIDSELKELKEWRGKVIAFILSISLLIISLIIGGVWNLITNIPTVGK